jgi:hypothetical protein
MSPKYVCGGHIGRRESLVDAYVQEVLVDYLETIDPVDLLPPVENAADYAAKAAALQAERDRYQLDYEADYITGAEWFKYKNDLDPQIEAANARAVIAVSPGIRLAYGVAGKDDIPKAWKALSLIQKRSVIAAVVDVQIMPATNSRTFRREDIKIDPITLRE